MARRSVRRAVAIAVMAAHNYQCYYCGRRAAEADHVVPANHGGTDEFENMLASCLPCNRSKSDHILPGLALVNALQVAKKATPLAQKIYSSPKDIEFYSGKKMVSIALPKKMWADISEFRYSAHTPSETEAVRRLIQAGLDALMGTRGSFKGEG